MTLTVHLAATSNSAFGFGFSFLAFSFALSSVSSSQVQIFTPKSNSKEIFISHFSNIGASSSLAENENIIQICTMEIN